MSVMDIIRNWSERKKEKKEKFKEMQEDNRLEEMLIERKKSANRRELERYMREDEEKQIKMELDRIHKKQNKDNWSSNTILKKDKSILTNDRPILKEKNIFMNQKNMFMNQGSMFKW